MKKIYSLAFVVLLGLNAIAQQKSNVVVFSEDGETFFAFLNGVKQNATAQSNVRITDVPGQSASLRLVFANSSDQPLKQDLHFMEPNQEHTIKVKRDKKGVLKMRYFGAVALSESTSTAPAVAYTATEVPSSNTTTTNTTNTSGTVNTTGTTENVNMNMQVSDPNMNSSSQTVTTTTTTTTNTTGTTNNNGGNGSGSLNVNVNENGFNMNVSVSGTENGENGSGSINMNVSGMESETSETVSSSTTTTTTTTSSSSSSGYSSNSSSTTTTNGNTGYTTTTSSGSCAYAMDEASFSKMKGAIASNAFDDTKLSTAKTATKGSCLSTEQVKQVMMLFNMDDDRLTYAKYAYDYTLDKNNFYLLGDAFVFDGNKEELNQFIESKR